MVNALDAVVVGSGPNGLAAAILLAQAGLHVRVIEARDTIGGGARTAELTLPQFRHDVCSAIHPTAALSPFFRALPLEAHGLVWIQPPAPLAHPLDDGPAAMLERSVEETGATLGEDAQRYARLVGPLVRRAAPLYEDLLGAMRFPSHPFVMARFGLLALRSAAGLARGHFQGAPAQALFAGCAAHSVLPLERTATAAFGLVLGLAGHAVGWPLPRGGSQAISDALASLLQSLGGEIETGHRVRSIDELPEARALLFDVAPKHLVAIAGKRLPEAYADKLLAFRYGPGVFKVDWALDGPIPWRAAECARAGTVHVGGTLEEIAASEAAPWRGEHAERPFVLLAQQSLFDASRAPPGKHTGWAYCHVPNGSRVDMTNRIEAQVERFAPGFRDRILARKTTSAPALEDYNANCVGGDMTGGVNDLTQMFARPVARLAPYATPDPSIFLCSSSTPPGGAVHGMCGYFAARCVLRKVFGKTIAPARLAGAPDPTLLSS